MAAEAARVAIKELGQRKEAGAEGQAETENETSAAVKTERSGMDTAADEGAAGVDSDKAAFDALVSNDDVRAAASAALSGAADKAKVGCREGRVCVWEGAPFSNVCSAFFPLSLSLTLALSPVSRKGRRKAHAGVDRGAG